ncbi:MFS transporter [Pseudomonas capeferrum]|uniref:MFS transporter n=1 Tax=Pseudomonas capeferrum TaxID=1495066 RepID=UPI0015E411E2|nr:MFS transporter [Pseudomonas capeferrum]MBA1204212.1 MFS transporter [Pseudomonas capeferrum]
MVLNRTVQDPDEFSASWKILLLALLGMTTCVTAALLYGFGVLVGPLQEAFGWTRSEIHLAITCMFTSTILAAQLVAWLNKRYGIRAVTITSLVALSLTYLSALLINGSILSLYAVFTILPLAGLGTLQVTWTQVVNLWFVRNRGLALAITLSGTGLAAAITPPLLSWAIQKWGWQSAFFALAAQSLFLTLPMAICLLRPSLAPTILSMSRQRDDGARLEGMGFTAALRQRRFWICNLAFSVAVSGVIAMITNIVPMLQDKGLTALQASSIFGSFGLALIGGRIISGYLIDRFWAPGVACISLSMPALGCLLFLFGSSDTSLLIFATVLVGFGTGAEYDIAAFLVVRYFGLREYGRLFAITFGLTTASAAFSPLFFWLLFDTSMGYSSLLIYGATCFIISAIMILAMGKYPSRPSHSPSAEGELYAS